VAEFVYIAKSLKIPKDGGFRIRKSKKRQHNGQKKKDKQLSAKHTIKLKTIDVFIGSCVVLQIRCPLNWRCVVSHYSIIIHISCCNKIDTILI